VIGNDAEQFGRMITAMVTPFDDNLNLDMTAVDRLIDHLLATRTSAIVVAGTTGESPTLESDEKKLLLERVIKRVGGKAKVIMGTGSNSTAASVKATVQATEQGADGILLVAPYYNKPNQAGLVAHYSQVAQSTKLPVVIYNIPGRTGINIEPPTVLSLAEKFANIAALKDSTGSVEQSQEIASKAVDKFRIYSGDDYLTLPFLSIGACGIISVASHIVGEKINEMIEHFFAGRLDQARALHYQLLPIFKGLFTAPNPVCVKYALSKLNLCRPNLRAPLVELADDQRKTLDAVLTETKFLSLAKVS
jgi:4-hydroxy-tetrahydrodipicolinate synthase